MDEKNDSVVMEQQAVNDGLKIGVLIATIFIPLLGIILGIVFMTDGNPDKKKVGKLWLYVGLSMVALSCICSFLYFIFFAAMASMQ